jgi:hypothetical protein
MQVFAGDTVEMRDGRMVYVTDAADTQPDAWRTYSRSDYDRDGSFVVTSQMPAETIFVGHVEGNENATVVSDMSEVVHVHKVTK